MGGVTMQCDPDGTPTDPALRTCLKQLAQRGAKLAVQYTGAAVEIPRMGAEVAVAWVDIANIPALNAAGWLTDIGNGSFILSPTGRTIVRLMKAGPSPAEASAGGSPALPELAPRAAPESPLAWFRSRRHKDGSPLLCDEAFNAGERLNEDFNRAQMMPRTTVNWEAVSRTDDESRGMAGIARERGGGASAAQERVRRALAAVPPEFAGLLMDVCCFGLGLPDAEKSNGMPQRSAHYLLAIALKILARHYGLLPPADKSWQPRRRTRHWASDNYRPTIDGT